MSGPTTIVAILGVVGTTITAVVGYVIARAQLRAGQAGAAATSESAAADRALRAWESLLEPMREEVDSLREEVADARSEVATERREVAGLRWTVQRLVTHVRPIIAWIDTGAPPPPAPVHAELRQIIDQEGDPR